MVKLIDFDHAMYANEAEDFGERYGTVGFAAPEQYSGEPMDPRTDVYAIGALLYYMCRGKPPGREPEFGSSGRWQSLDGIIIGCMAQKKEDRYQSAAEVEASLLEWISERSKEYAIKSLNIIFAGAKAGIGTTHIALGYSNFLTRNGCPTLYQEEYDSEAGRNLVRNLGAREDGSGVYHKGCLYIRPYYGSSIRIPYRYFPVITKDIGAGWQAQKEMPEADHIVLVCGGKWWETEVSLRAIRKLNTRNNLILLWNHISGEVVPRLPADLCDVPCLNMPFFSNPLKTDREADACYRDLHAIMTGGSGKWNEKKKRRLWKRKED